MSIKLTIDTFNTALTTAGYTVHKHLSKFTADKTTQAAYVFAREKQYTDEVEKRPQNRGTIFVEILTKQKAYRDNDGSNNDTNAAMIETLETALNSVAMPVSATINSVVHTLGEFWISSIGMGIESETGCLRADAVLEVQWSR